MPRQSLLKIRRDVTENWVDVVLDEGEFGYDTTTKQLKIGDGSTKFQSLGGINADLLDSEHGFSYALSNHNHKLDDLAAPDDNTDLDASTSKHGLLPKLPVPIVGGDPQILYAGNQDPYWSTPPNLADLTDVMIVAPWPYVGDSLVYNGSYWSPTPIHHSMARQAIINGNFDIWQRGTAFTAASKPANSDDTYLPDRWVLLSDGNDIVDVSRESTVIPVGSAYSLKCEVETANKKFGWLQILESADSLKFAGKVVSLSFQARTTTDKVIENLRAAIISWDGTADTVTSDIVSSWGSEGADPTLATNWTYENTPANLALSTSFQTFTIENISVDTSGMKNLAVFIWVDDTDAAADDLLYLAQVQLCAGDVALPFEPKSYADELAACQRYFYRVDKTDYRRFGNGLIHNSTDAYIFVPTPVTMRVDPTITKSADSTFTLFAGGVAFNTITLSIESHDSFGFVEIKAVKSGYTPGHAAMLAAHSTDAAYIELSAEL